MKSIIIVFLLPAVGVISTARAASQEEINRAISQLSSSDFAIREKAQDQLLDVVAEAEDALRQVLKDESLSREARDRIGYILSFVNVPAKGVVWRGRYDKQLAGAKDGDILISIDGQPVRTYNWFLRVAGDYQPMRRLTMWRNGKGRFELRADLRDCRNGFSAWPDYIELYRRYGHRGKWDAQVEKAIRLTRSKKPAEKVFQAVWKTGCRDALMVNAWFHFYTENGDTKAAEALRKKLPTRLKGDYPGGWYRHGWLKRRIAAHLICTGKRADVLEYLDMAVKDAIAAGAWKGLPALRRQQMSVRIMGPIDQAEKFWKDHVGHICARSGYTQPSEVPALLKLMTHRLAAEDGPARALVFLDKQPDCYTVRLLKTYYQKQKLAAARVPKKEQQGTAILLKEVKWTSVFDAGMGRYRSRQLVRRLPVPCRVEYEVRMAEPRVGLNRWRSTTKTYIDESNRWLLQTWLERTGCIRAQVGRIDPDLMPWSASLVNPTHWLKTSYEIYPRMVRCSVNGVPVLAVYSNLTNARLLFGTQSCGCLAENRNLKIYLITTANADAKAIEKEIGLKAEGIRNGDLKQAKASYEKLLKQLAAIPEAKVYLEEIKREWGIFEAIMSKEGLSLCSRKMYEAAKGIDGANSDWKFINERLEITSENRHGRILRIPLPAVPDDFEVTGLVEFEKPARNTLACFTWTAGSSTNQRTRCIFWPAWRLAQMGGHGKSTRIKNVDFSSAMPFCIRMRGDEAVVFLRFGAKPDLRLRGLRRSGTDFYIWVSGFAQETRVKVSKLRIRHLPKKTKLDEPVRMPIVDKKSTGDKRQEW